MGIFFKKKEVKSCDICGKDANITLSDGYICKDCFITAYKCKPIVKKFKDLNLEATRQAINEGLDIKNKLDNFTLTDVRSLVQFDDNHSNMLINKKLFSYDDLIDFELIENGKTLVTKGGLGPAIAGGILFGGVGAIAGAVVGKKTTTEKINKMFVRLTFKTNFRPVHEDVILIFGKTNKNSNSYLNKLQQAKDLLLKLDSIKSN